MSTDISAEIKELPRLRTRQLRTLWEELFAKPPHPKLRRDLMIPILAYQIQENAYGGLKPSTRKRLEKLAEELERNPKAELQPVLRIKSGTKLIRHWQGRRHEVLANDEGFDYRGKRYRSLSEIAREITGTRWSGPLFFGLKRNRESRPA
jgi:Protein of unknown function (DUF2924)